MRIYNIFSSFSYLYARYYYNYKLNAHEDKFRYGYREENQKKRPNIFRTKWQEVRRESYNASIKMQFHILSPQRCIPSSQSPPPLLLSPCFSFYSLNNRTAASGRRRGVTSKRPFRKMQMHVPLTRLRTMRRPLAPPPTVIKRAREDNLRTEEVDALYLPLPALRALSLMRTRAVLRLSTLIRYFNREGEERGRTFRVVARQTFRRCTGRQSSNGIYA